MAQLGTRLLSLLVLLFVFPAVMAPAQTPDQPSPAYNLNQAQTFLGEIAPLVESVAGIKFVKVPTVKLIEKKEMIAILSDELRPQFKNLNPDLSDTKLDDMSKNQAAFFAGILLGKYGLRDRTLYLMPGNTSLILNIAKIDLKNTLPTLKLVIAHELMRALQDQEGILTRIKTITDAEGLSALASTIEGHALFVLERVAEKLGLAEISTGLIRMFSVGSLVAVDPTQEMTAKITSSQYDQTYLGGKIFIEYHFRKGGLDRIWEILHHPPPLLSMIAKPETYSPEKPPKKDYAPLFKDLEVELGVVGWNIKNIELGKKNLESIFAKMYSPYREEIIAQVEHIQAFFTQRPNPKATVNVTRIVLRQNNFATRYFLYLEEMVKRNLEEVAKSDMFTVAGVRFEDFTLIRSDKARLIAFDIQSIGAEATSHFLTVRIARGNIILEFFTSEYSLSEADIARVAELLFARIAQDN